MKIVEVGFKNPKYKTLDKELKVVLPLVEFFLSEEGKNMDKDEVDFTKDCIKSLESLKRRVNVYGV